MSKTFKSKTYIKTTRYREKFIEKKEGWKLMSLSQEVLKRKTANLAPKEEGWK